MKRLLIIFFAIVFTRCIPIPPITKDKVKKVVDPFAHKKFVTHDFNYEPSLKSVMLYPLGNITTQSLESPVIYLGQTAPLILEFDDLSTKRSSFSAKIIHCNQNWKISSLNEIEFVNDLNLFEFDAPRSSYNTRQKYFHYTFRIPPVKASGNYLIKVFRKGHERDLVLIRRFMVYEKKWEVTAAAVASGKNNPGQTIVCKVHYGGEVLENPQGVKVLIRQNQRWDNAILLTKFNARERANKNLLYKTALNAKAFRGGNEFRRFDMSSFQFIGQRIYSAETLKSGNMVTLEVDQPRVSRDYVTRQDFNGGYIVQDERGGDAKFATDYANVKFTLKCDELDENVYVIGKFNNWKTSPANEMSYNLDTQQYEATLFLKQGIYDYMYGHKPDEGGTLFFQQIEGSHFKARNQYEVFVYYRPKNARTDQLVGYITFGSGG